jgi:cytochrome c553
VPPGSIAKGEALVATINCASCHGPGLHGLEPAPALAGRSPVYILRQLYDFKSGARAGLMGGPMKLVTEQLTLDDMIAAAAYIASLPP